jgi:Protein of unknown function (DUF1045)
MHLADGIAPQQLRQRLQEVVAKACPLPVPMLAVRPLEDFLALQAATAIDAWHPLRRLADACVMACQALRRPLDAAEFERRSASVTDEAQRDHLLRWGYPFVFDRWRFHMTLSDAGRGHDAVLRQRAERHFAAALAEPLRATGVALFTQAAPGVPLRLAERIS